MRKTNCLVPGPEGGRIVEDSRAVDVYIDFLKRLPRSIRHAYSHGLREWCRLSTGTADIQRPWRQGNGSQPLPNGININVKCEFNRPSALQEAVKESGAQLGLAFDGDADRLIAVDEKRRNC